MRLQQCWQCLGADVKGLRLERNSDSILKSMCYPLLRFFLIEAVSLLHYVGPCAVVAELVSITGSEIHTTQVTTNR